MSIWEDFSIEPRIHDMTSRHDDHHFGRPFLTAYQIAISFAERHERDMDRIGKGIGGRDTGLPYSLAQYLARELSQRIRTGRITEIEGRFLHGAHLRALVYRSPDGNMESSTGSASLSMFRLRD